MPHCVCLSRFSNWSWSRKKAEKRKRSSEREFDLSLGCWCQTGNMNMEGLVWRILNICRVSAEYKSKLNKRFTLQTKIVSLHWTHFQSTQEENLLKRRFKARNRFGKYDSLLQLFIWQQKHKQVCKCRFQPALQKSHCFYLLFQTFWERFSQPAWMKNRVSWKCQLKTVTSYSSPPTRQHRHGGCKHSPSGFWATNNPTEE